MGVPEILSDVALLSAEDHQWLMTSLVSMPKFRSRPPGSGGLNTSIAAAADGPGKTGPNKAKATTDAEQEKAPPGKNLSCLASIHAKNPLYQSYKTAEKAHSAALRAIEVGADENKMKFQDLLEVTRVLVDGSNLKTRDGNKMSPSDRKDNADLALKVLKEGVNLPLLVRGHAPLTGLNLIPSLRRAFLSLRALERAREAWIFRPGGPHCDTNPTNTIVGSAFVPNTTTFSVHAAGTDLSTKQEGEGQGTKSM